LGIWPEASERSVLDLLRGEASAKDVIIERPKNAKFSRYQGNDPRLRVIPANLNLTRAEVELQGKAGKEFLLRKALQGVRGFDYLLVDCPPSLGLLTLNALTTVRDVYIPLQTEFLALHGLSWIVKTVKRVVREKLNPNLEIAGVIATRFHKRRKLHQEVVATARRHFKDTLCRTLIRECIALAEAPSYCKTILEYAPQSHGAKDYLNLAWEVMLHTAGQQLAEHWGFARNDESEREKEDM